MEKKIGVMFVCTGNICRSPMAEAVFQSLIDEEGISEYFIVASSGITDYHVGERPHQGTRKILREKKIFLNPDKRALFLKRRDYDQYDYIVGMDEGNLRSLKWHGNKAKLLMAYAPEDMEYGLEVPDPYYSGGFDQVFELVYGGCKGLLKQIRLDCDIP